MGKNLKNQGGFNFASDQFQKFRVDLISRMSDAKRFREFYFREKAKNSRKREI